MPVFKYKAINQEGEVIEDTMEASSISAVTENLDRLDYIPLNIIEKKESVLKFAEFEIGEKVDFKDKIIFTKQFITLYKAGVPLLACLEALQEQTKNKTMKKVIRDIYKDVESGKSFSEAISKHKKIFPDIYVNMVKVGEIGGVLDKVMDRLEKFLTHENEIKTKVKKAMRYPIFVMIGIIVTFITLITFIVPKFVTIFDKAEAELPLPTIILIGINTAVTNYWFIVFPGILLLIIAFMYYIKTPAGHYNWDKVKLKIPVFGDIILKSNMTRFSNIFETLNRSGLPIIETVKILSDVIGNKCISEEIDRALEEIKNGEELAVSLKKSNLFPAIVIQMISIGEKSGSLDAMLANISEYYDEEVDDKVKNLTSLIEPMITVVLACVILFIALGIFMPMWDIMSLVGK